MEAVGGNPLPGSKSLGSTFFLANDWKIKPYEANHVFRVDGNLYAPDGTSPFIQTDGVFNIFLEQQVSSLVDSTVAQLAEIQYGAFNNGITVDQNNVTGRALPLTGDVESSYPLGTFPYPVDNFPDAKLLADYWGFGTLQLIGSGTATTGDDLDDYTVLGETPSKTILTIEAGAAASGLSIENARLTGTLDGSTIVRQCYVVTLAYVEGMVFQCVLEGTISLSGVEAYFIDCWSGLPDDAGDPSIDLNGGLTKLNVQSHSGYLMIKDAAGPTDASFDGHVGLENGILEIDSSVTAGNITVRGIGEVINNGGPAVVVNERNLIQGHKINMMHEFLVGETASTDDGTYPKVIDVKDPVTAAVIKTLTITKAGDIYTKTPS